MSEDFFAVCKKCLANEVHFHKRSDLPVVHVFFGGVGRGTVVYIDPLVEDHEFVVDSGGNLAKLDDLRAKRGAGK